MNLNLPKWLIGVTALQALPVCHVNNSAKYTCQSVLGKNKQQTGQDCSQKSGLEKY